MPCVNISLGPSAAGTKHHQWLSFNYTVNTECTRRMHRLNSQGDNPVYQVTLHYFKPLKTIKTPRGIMRWKSALWLLMDHNVNVNMDTTLTQLQFKNIVIIVNISYRHRSLVSWSWHSYLLLNRLHLEIIKWNKENFHRQFHSSKVKTVYSVTNIWAMHIPLFVTEWNYQAATDRIYVRKKNMKISIIEIDATIYKIAIIS